MEESAKPKTLDEKRVEFFFMISKLVVRASIHDIDLMPIAFLMTAEEVNRYFKEGKSQLDGYKKISPHQIWLAIDFVVVKDGKIIWNRTSEYELLGGIWEEIGGVWGGRWKSLNDIYHFQYGEPGK